MDNCIKRSGNPYVLEFLEHFKHAMTSAQYEHVKHIVDTYENTSIDGFDFNPSRTPYMYIVDISYRFDGIEANVKIHF